MVFFQLSGQFRQLLLFVMRCAGDIPVPYHVLHLPFVMFPQPVEYYTTPDMSGILNGRIQPFDLVYDGKYCIPGITIKQLYLP